MYNKTIIRLGFCHTQHNRGLGKGTYLHLDYYLHEHKNPECCIRKQLSTKTKTVKIIANIYQDYIIAIKLHRLDLKDEFL